MTHNGRPTTDTGPPRNLIGLPWYFLRPTIVLLLFFSICKISTIKGYRRCHILAKEHDSKKSTAYHLQRAPCLLAWSVFHHRPRIAQGGTPLVAASIWGRYGRSTGSLSLWCHVVCRNLGDTCLWWPRVARKMWLKTRWAIKPFSPWDDLSRLLQIKSTLIRQLLKSCLIRIDLVCLCVPHKQIFVFVSR